MTMSPNGGAARFLGLMLLAGILSGLVQIAAGQAASTSTGANNATNSLPAPVETLARDFFGAIREGNTRKFLSYVPDGGINFGAQPQHLTRAEVETQLLHHRGLYCRVFNSSCIDGEIRLDASAPACSDRELLTRSEKVRTAATEAVRNGVRQAILVAEVKNNQCGGAHLVDFIFNFEHGEWKLFSVP